MTRLVVREMGRWARTVAIPAVALATVVLLHRAAESPNALIPTSRAPTVWLVALGLSSLWLATSAVRATLQPRRDRRAAEHLQDLRVRAALPEHALLCVLQVLWESPAGQRVAAVNVRTGTVHEVWLAESELTPGTYALVLFRQGEGRFVASAAPGAILGAKRYESRGSATGKPSSPGARPGWRERRAATQVIREAETLIRAS